MTDKMFKMHTKDWNGVIAAKDRFEAYRKFFEEVKKDPEQWMSRLGQLLILSDGDEKYPFRVVPTLTYLGLMSREDALHNLSLIADGFTVGDLEKMIVQDAKTLGYVR